uniref:CCHC-type domain-containing protein n=1 Tax=Tanacetum cinerariifolium TaxID=118510 RepID=A0A699H557_TANCI|nr:hypothetical protein [Tanacetum cinerariifolium]
MYKTKTDTNQSSSSQSGGDAQVDHSKSTHEVDGGKKKTTTTTTSTHAENKSSINQYACPVGIKCYRCQEVSHTSNQCRATKRVNLAEGDKMHSGYEDEGLIISPNAVFEDNDDHSKAFIGLVRRLVLRKVKKVNDTTSSKHGARLTKMCSTLSLTGEVSPSRYQYYSSTFLTILLVKVNPPCATIVSASYANSSCAAVIELCTIFAAAKSKCTTFKSIPLENPSSPLFFISFDMKISPDGFMQVEHIEAAHTGLPSVDKQGP